MCIWGRDAYRVKTVAEEKPLVGYKMLALMPNGQLLSPGRGSVWVGDTMLGPNVNHSRRSHGVFCFRDDKNASAWDRYAVCNVEVKLDLWGQVAFHWRSLDYPRGFRAEHARVTAWRKQGQKKWQPLATLPGRKSEDRAEALVESLSADITMVDGQHRRAAQDALDIASSEALTVQTNLTVQALAEKKARELAKV